MQNLKKPKLIVLELPKWLIPLENILEEEKVLCYEKFLKSIPVGVNLEKIKYVLAIGRITRLISIQKENLKNSSNSTEIISPIIGYLKIIRKFHRRKLNNSKGNWSEMNSISKYVKSEIKLKIKSPRDSSAWLALRSALKSVSFSKRSTIDSIVCAINSKAILSEDWASAKLSAWKEEADFLIKCLENLKTEIRK